MQRLHPDFILTDQQRETIAAFIAGIDTLLPQWPINAERLRQLRGKLVGARKANDRHAFRQFWHEWEAGYRADIATAMNVIARRDQVAEKAA